MNKHEDLARDLAKIVENVREELEAGTIRFVDLSGWLRAELDRREG